MRENYTLDPLEILSFYKKLSLLIVCLSIISLSCAGLHKPYYILSLILMLLSDYYFVAKQLIKERDGSLVQHGAVTWRHLGNVRGSRGQRYLFIVELQTIHHCG